jgi:hypothetical protein
MAKCLLEGSLHLAGRRARNTLRSHIVQMFLELLHLVLVASFVSNNLRYPALFKPAKEGGITITFPDFGWGISEGEAEHDFLDMALALLQTLVQEHIR